MKITAVIQARMGSTRLPGKVLMPLAGRRALDHVLERVKAAKSVDRVVIATSTLAADDAVAEYCGENGIDFVRGSENDVLSRYLLAFDRFPSDWIIRITADCPLMDPALIDGLVTTATFASDIDYCSNTQAPRKIPHGLDIEIFRAGALQKAGREATANEEREHVTPYLYRHPELFGILSSAHPIDLSSHRWTLDTEADYKLLDNILKALPPGAFRWQDTLAVLEEHPEWLSINSSIAQKTLSPGS